MKAILIFLRHLADYIVGITYMLIAFGSGFLIIGEYFPDSEPGVKFFVHLVIASIILGIYGIIADCMDKTNEDINPKEKHKYNIEIKGKDIDKEHTCMEYTIEHTIDGDIILMMDGVKSIVPGETAILVTEIE